MNVALRNSQREASVVPILPERSDATAPHHLVTIHGIADTADVWKQAVTKLTPQFRSYQQLSLKWHSEVGEPYAYPDPGAVLADAWRQLPDGPKVVVSHSFGCNALLSMAQRQPLDDVDALILVSPYYKAGYEDFNWALFRRYVSEFERFLLSSIDVRMQGRALTEDARATILNRLMQSYSPPSWIMFFTNWTQTPTLTFQNFKMPCLLATGSEDFSILPGDVETLAGCLPDAEYRLLDGLGHFSLIEDPAFTATHINDFLQKRLYQ
ncbi:MAG: alpha/beta hydrolase [Pseudomonadota bacterium]